MTKLRLGQVQLTVLWTAAIVILCYQQYVVNPTGVEFDRLLFMAVGIGSVCLLWGERQAQYTLLYGWAIVLFVTFSVFYISLVLRSFGFYTPYEPMIAKILWKTIVLGGYTYVFGRHLLI